VVEVGTFSGATRMFRESAEYSKLTATVEISATGVWSGAFALGLFMLEMLVLHCFRLPTTATLVAPKSLQELYRSAARVPIQGSATRLGLRKKA
jgi:hypothetical protein